MSKPTKASVAPAEIAPPTGTTTLPAIRRVAFSPTVVETVCEYLRQGKSLREIGRMEGMPSRETLRQWGERHPDVLADITRAREQGFEELAERGLEEARSADDPAKGRLSLDALRWFLAKLHPERYGERIRSEVSGPNGAPIAIESEVALHKLEAIFANAAARRAAIPNAQQSDNGEDLA